MSYILKVSELTRGGNASDNPVPLTMANYQLADWELELILVPENVIAPYKGSTYQVTGLAVWDPIAQAPLLGPDDDIRVPCPPVCE